MWLLFIPLKRSARTIPDWFFLAERETGWDGAVALGMILLLNSYSFIAGRHSEEDENMKEVFNVSYCTFYISTLSWTCSCCQSTGGGHRGQNVESEWLC